MDIDEGKISYKRRRRQLVVGDVQIAWILCYYLSKRYFLCWNDNYQKFKSINSFFDSFMNTNTKLVEFVHQIQ